MTNLSKAASLAAITLSLVAAGCGNGDTKEGNEYVDAVNKAQTDFVESVGSIQATATPTGDPEQGQQIFERLGDSIGEIVKDLEDIEPPGDVEDLHTNLISEMQGFETSVREAGESLTTGDPEQIRDAQSKFAQDVGQVQTNVSKTITEINKKLQE